MPEMTEGEILKELLFYTPKNVYDAFDQNDINACERFGVDYKKFLDSSKTERLCVSYIESLARDRGFTQFNPYRVPYERGEKFIYVNRGKSVILGVIGRRDLMEGANITVAHIDSPRLDFKPAPLYEEENLAFIKTHYYGGIKKYQWTALPLSLHGVVMTTSGDTVEIDIGEDETDPVFCITDLLPHLAAEQMAKKMTEGIAGEGLNILIGSIPFKDDKASQKVKINILKIINEKYGIVEEDFYSAELEATPAFKASDVGLDRSMIGSYGQDDRVCAFTALEALFSLGVPERTSICVLADKEEVGSMGSTGMQSRFFEYFMEDLSDMYGVPLRKVLSNSTCLSADVNVAFDPNYPDVSEKRNNAFLNGGVAFTKYTGSRGKSGSSDASAELLGKLRALFNDNNIIWQIGELGKVDQGGGGTVAQYVANLNIDTIDCGVPVLSMHSPFEVVSKGDVYMTFRAFSEFYSRYF